MQLATWFLLGLEIARFAPADDAADALAGSLDAVQTGAWTLSPYDGPAIQPCLAWRHGPLELGLAPAAAWRSEQTSAGDGRQAALKTFQWRAELRGRWCFDPWFAGLDAALSNGSATLAGTRIAEGTQIVEGGPTLGARAPLGEHAALVGRVRWPFRFVGEAVEHGPAGAVALEWRF